MKPTNAHIALLLVITCATLFASCDKDNDNDEKPKTKTELLTTATWKRTALTSNPAYDWNADGITATDVLSIMLPCERDNFETFRTIGIMVTDEGPTKCDAADPQTWETTWQWIENESKIRFDGIYDYTLVELSPTTLKLRTTFEENGVTYTHNETYSH